MANCSSSASILGKPPLPSTWREEGVRHPKDGRRFFEITRTVSRRWHRLRFEIFQGIQHARHKTIQPSKHQAIDALEGRSFGRFALQDVELMAQNKDLRLEPCPLSEEPGQHACQQHEKIDHGARTSPDSPSAR
jgi:hypothetical protein